MKFTIEIRDYEPRTDPDPLTIDRIEAAIDDLLVDDGSDGTVIVTKEE